ncbi:MAG: hypothetical protein ABIA62_03720 [Candidatus Woesearchaeota archaeon]
MEIESIRRSAYWFFFFVFIILLAVFMISDRLSLMFKLILICLMAILSSMFHLREQYGFLSFILTIIAGFSAGAVLANDANQFWIFGPVFIIFFFLGCKCFEKNWLGV